LPIALHQEIARLLPRVRHERECGRAFPMWARWAHAGATARPSSRCRSWALTPDRPYRKCARVVGDVLANTIPTADQGFVYGTPWVRIGADLLQPSHPLLDGHGKLRLGFDDDPPGGECATRRSGLAPDRQRGPARRQSGHAIPSNFAPISTPPSRSPTVMRPCCLPVAQRLARHCPWHRANRIPPPQWPGGGRP